MRELSKPWFSSLGYLSSAKKQDILLNILNVENDVLGSIDRQSNKGENAKNFKTLKSFNRTTRLNKPELVKPFLHYMKNIVKYKVKVMQFGIHRNVRRVCFITQK